MIDTHKVMTAQILVMSCELNCASDGFSCKFLDLAAKQSPQSTPVISLIIILNQIS
jgi:hypothetical protein